MNDFKTLLFRFVKELEDQDNAAHDLWTWLPSYQEAQRYHGDYASEVQPCIAGVMKEAAMYIANVKDNSPRAWTLEEAQWFGRCPCGEPHVGE